MTKMVKESQQASNEYWFYLFLFSIQTSVSSQNYFNCYMEGVFLYFQLRIKRTDSRTERDVKLIQTLRLIIFDF